VTNEEALPCERAGICRQGVKDTESATKSEPHVISFCFLCSQFLFISISLGLLIDWLQLLDPELLAHRPSLQRKLLFERNDQHLQVVTFKMPF